MVLQCWCRQGQGEHVGTLCFLHGMHNSSGEEAAHTGVPSRPTTAAGCDTCRPDGAGCAPARNATANFEACDRLASKTSKSSRFRSLWTISAEAAQRAAETCARMMLVQTRKC